VIAMNQGFVKKSMCGSPFLLGFWVKKRAG